jgi:steroid delta-isomerase
MDEALLTAALLNDHVERFNHGIRTGDFEPMLGGFAPDAELVFEGVPFGPFVGRDAIAEAYRVQPPTDEVRLLGAPRVEGGALAVDYAWAAEGTKAGRMILTPRDGAIARLVVTFE